MHLSHLFSQPKPIIGMVHLLPLPGTPRYRDNIHSIFEQAEWEARTLEEAGIDGIIIENFGDEPYFIGEPTPEQFAIISAITYSISQKATIPVGINVQFNAWQAEMAIAHTCGASFVRVEVFIDTVISAQGQILPCSAQITRLRRTLGAQGVYLWADIQTKYTTNLIPQPLSQSAQDAQEAGADALIVTGSGTGKATPLEAVAETKKAVDLPVFVGSGTNKNNLSEVLNIADGVIVGSALKEGGNAFNKVSKSTASQFMQSVNIIRKQIL